LANDGIGFLDRPGNIRRESRSPDHTTPMNTPRVASLFRRSAAFAAFLVVAGAAPAASNSSAASSAASVQAPDVNVTVRAEGEALARGFEEAFRSFSTSPVFVTYTREDKGFVTLAGIRSLRAVGAVVFVTLERGPSLALPARSIVVVTDERPASP
jgi:hypothetical protein